MSADRYTQSRDWLETPRARLFVQYEQRLLRSLLPRLTGYRCLQLGTWGHDPGLLEHTGTLCAWRIGLGPSVDAQACFDGRHLPLATGSVDALIVAHGLEQVAQPHRLLRECSRVLNERGQLIVLAFNPLSLWTWRQGLPLHRQPRFTVCSAPPSASRLCDWLRLLEFEPEQLWRYGLGFPLFGHALRVDNGGGWRRPLAWTAQAYALTARRYTVPCTPVRRQPRYRRPVAANGLARSAARDVTCRR